jgi:hypothetical protein
MIGVDDSGDYTRNLPLSKGMIGVDDSGQEVVNAKTPPKSVFKRA